jgi:hypothetical protein
MTSRIQQATFFGLTSVSLILAITLVAATPADQNAAFVLEMKGARAAVVVSIDGLTAGEGRSAPGSIVLKGVQATGAFSRWTRSGRRAVPETLTIFLKKSNGEVLGGWRIRSATPIKSDGPPLAGKGGNEIAMETLELSYEGIEPIY